MQTLRGEYFIKRDFGFYDTGILAVMGATIFNLYEVIRRFTWRSTERGDRAVRRLVSQGFVISRTSQAVLGKHLGISRVQTNKLIQQMKELGWLEVLELNKGRTFAYKLGERVQDSSGRGHEIFYADAWMSEVFGLLDAEANCRFGEQKHPEDEDSTEVDSVEEYNRALQSIRRLTIEERIEFLKDRLTASQFTGGVNSTLQGGVNSSLPGNRENSLKEENDIEVPREEGDFSPDQESDQPASGQEDPHTSATEQTHSPLSQFDLDAAVARAGVAAKRRAEEQLTKSKRKKQKAANLKGRPKTLSERAQLGKLQDVWLSGCQERWPDLDWGKWGKTERGQCRQLLEAYKFETVEMMLRYVIERWDEIQEEMFGKEGDHPSLGMVLKLRQRFAPKAQTYAKVSAVYREYRAWRKANPRKMNAPADLQKRYDAARPELRALGLIKH